MTEGTNATAHEEPLYCCLNCKSKTRAMNSNSQKAMLTVSCPFQPSPQLTSLLKDHIAAGVSSSPICNSTFVFRLSRLSSSNKSIKLEHRLLYVGSTFFAGVNVSVIAPPPENPPTPRSISDKDFFARRCVLGNSAQEALCSPNFSEADPSPTFARANFSQIL